MESDSGKKESQYKGALLSLLVQTTGTQFLPNILRSVENALQNYLLNSRRLKHYPLASVLH